jgi:hypothetical protein
MKPETAIPEISVGEWRFASEGDSGIDTALSHHGCEFWAGGVTSARLRQAGHDLLKLADEVEKVGF